MFNVAMSPESPNYTRSVVIRDSRNRVVAVMSTRDHGWEGACALALKFVEAEDAQTKLIEALAVIAGLQAALAEKEAA